MKSIHERVMILHHHSNYDLKTSWAIVKESAVGQYGGKPCPAGGPYKKEGCEIPKERNCKNSTKGLCSRKPTAPPGQDGRYEHYKKSCTDKLTPWDKNPCKSFSLLGSAPPGPKVFRDSGVADTPLTPTGRQQSDPKNSRSKSCVMREEKT